MDVQPGPAGSSTMPDVDDKAREYTLAEAAQVCESSIDAIRQKVKRGKIREGRRTNSGKVTVLLTQSEIDAIRAARPFRIATGSLDGLPTRKVDEQSTISSHESSIVKALEDHIKTLREQLERAQYASEAIQRTLEKER